MVEIKDWPNYSIDEFGSIYSHYAQSLVKTHENGNGYLRIGLRKNNIRQFKSVHRLVARAYLPDYSEDLQVNHIDGNKLNNHISNLEMVTAKENIDHAIRLGLMKSVPLPRALSGRPLEGHKLTTHDVNYIKNSTMETRYLCLIFGVDRSHIKRFRSKANTRYK